MCDLVCLICKANLKSQDTKYSITSSSTKYTCIKLIDFVENVISNKIKTINSFTCDKCYGLLNELDYFEHKYNEKRRMLLLYMDYDIHKQTEDTPMEVPDEAESKAIKNIAYSCDYCENVFLEIEQLEEHNLTHVEEKRFECLHCGKIFISKPGLTLHIKNKHSNVETDIPIIDDKEIKLEVLDIVEESNDELEQPKKKRGRKKKELAVLKPAECGICNKKWKTITELKVHVASHDPSRPYICEVCGQAYKRKAALDIHIGMHNGINPFTCVYCKKSFTQKGALQRHIPIHTGETPYQCDLCGKRFVHHTSFSIHQLTHTGQKNYNCNICGTALMSGSHLKRHMRAHTGERKFECPTCGKRFAERYNLVAHQKVHENSGYKIIKKDLSNLKCGLCTFSTDSPAKLDQHTEYIHNSVLANNMTSITEIYEETPPDNQIWQILHKALTK